MKPIYIPYFIDEPDFCFNELLNLQWLEETEARKEYFMSDPPGISYTYGSGVAARTYISKEYNDLIKSIKRCLDFKYKTNYDVCFLNRYDGAKNALGWHADDSPEMNPEHPIAVVSFGAEREIWWREKELKGPISDDCKQKLGHGSLFIMPAGFQQINYHRIPKSGISNCGIRISLTFRNYKKCLE